MWNVVKQRVKQGYRSMAWPNGPAPPLPARYRGLPVIDGTKCPDDCRDCIAACPTDAIFHPKERADALAIDLGRCLYCTDCMEACPGGAIAFNDEFRQATRCRDDLVISDQALKLADALDEKSQRLFGRSLQLRQVSAGGCNGCEADINVLSTIVFDLGRFGIKIVASPRHADGIIITGPVTDNMKLALEKTYRAVPDPKIVIAVGACAISGGPFVDHPEQSNGADSIVPVDLYIPGCPPHPLTILDGLLRLLGRLESSDSVPTGT